MSYALSRLHELFGDDLFVRTSSAMQPTTRALELAGPVSRVLSDIRVSVLSDRAFHPELAETVFRVGASDHTEVAVLSFILAALQSSAPKIRLIVVPVNPDQVGTMLESGAIDLAVGYYPEHVGAQQSEVLFHEDFVCLFDAKACGVKPPLKLKPTLSCRTS